MLNDCCVQCCYSEMGNKWDPSARLCKMLFNDFDGWENIIRMYVHKRVLGQLPQPAFTSAKKGATVPLYIHK